MKCYVCGKPTTQGKGNRFERTMTPDDLTHMKKLKPNAKVKDKFELCNECYPKVYPGAAIRLTTPSPTLDQVKRILDRQRPRRD